MSSLRAAPSRLHGESAPAGLSQARPAMSGFQSACTRKSVRHTLVLQCLSQQIVGNDSDRIPAVLAAQVKPAQLSCGCWNGKSNQLTFLCAHLSLGCSFSGNFCSRPRRRKLMRPPKGAKFPRMKVARPNLACTDFQCCLPCTACISTRSRKASKQSRTWERQKSTYASPVHDANGFGFLMEL